MLEDAALEAVAQGADAGLLVLHVRQRQFGGFSQSDDPRHILGAAAPPPLLRSAANAAD